MEGRNLISIEDLSNDEILEVFRIADEMSELSSSRRSTTTLSDKILATVFYEPSTRTRLSFESAMHRLGGRVISAWDMEGSTSVAKGETLADTVKVISHYADILVMRHPWDGAVEVAARHSPVPVINAGDGSHEHPTQTLCDLYTLRREKGRIRGLTVVLCGDLRYGRTVHSLASALARFGAHILLVPAPGLDMPDQLLRKLALKHGQRWSRVPGVRFLNLDGAGFDAVYMTSSAQRALNFSDQLQLDDKPTVAKTPKFDAVYLTRYQKERVSGQAEGGGYPRIDSALLADPDWRDAIIMHPLPRVDEISQEIDSDPRSKYFTQIEYSVPVRMALLQFLSQSSASRSSQPQQGPQEYGCQDGDRGPDCSNGNCVTHFERGLAGAFRLLKREKTTASHILVIECSFCATELRIPFVGNRKTKKYCAYEPALESFVGEWLDNNGLILFCDEIDALAADFKLYSTGPQRQVLSARGINQAIEKLAREIAEQLAEDPTFCLVGVQHRGDIVARRIATSLKKNHDLNVPIGSLDVHPFRDDVVEGSEPSEFFDFSIEDKVVVVVDDVLSSGRTSRAAMNAILSGPRRGRPRDVKLAVLIDRGHRELPIEADFVGKNLPSAKSERVSVRLKESGDSDEAIVFRTLVDHEDEERVAKAAG